MLSLGLGCRNVSSAIVSSVIREIEIWRVAVLMVNRYADEAEANSFLRAEELAAEGDHAGAAIWRRVTVAIEQLTDTTRPRTDAPIWRGQTHMNVTEHRQGTARFRMLGWAKGAAEAAALDCEWMDWYRDGENTQQAPVTTAESKSRWTHSETGTRSP